jgi:hypothetical protein
MDKRPIFGGLKKSESNDDEILSQNSEQMRIVRKRRGSTGNAVTDSQVSKLKMESEYEVDHKPKPVKLVPPEPDKIDKDF